MISGLSTRVLRSSKPRPALASWGRLLAMLGLVALAASCSKDVSDIGVGLPDANANTGAYLIDTLTIRASTVLRDTVVSSASPYLLVGQYTDPLLGKLTARSAFRLGLPNAFSPDPTFVFDSVTLVLKPNSYRYGDTTKTQALVEVHRLVDPISATKYSFTSRRLTPLNYDSLTKLNRNPTLPVPKQRARPNLTTLRVPLDAAFGQQLLARGQAGGFTSQDELDSYLPGLVITPAGDDDAALLLLSATAADAALNLYYHNPTDPTTVITSSFTLAAGNRHFFQVRANRSTAGVQNLPRTSLQAVNSSLTGEQSFIEGAIGLQTRLEFPYLTDLRQFGNNLTVTDAQLTASVPTTTLSPFVPLPPSLSVAYSDGANHPTGLLVPEVKYTTGISALTGIDQGTYSWKVTSYCQAVLKNTRPNDGLLLSTTTPELPTRVVLGGPRNSLNKLALRLYFIQIK